MKFKNCPYGKEDFERRIQWYQEKVKEDIIPASIENDFLEFLWCDKVGGKVCYCGHCTDAYEEKDAANQRTLSKQRKCNKRDRYLKYKRHLKQLEQIVKGYPFPVRYEDEIYEKDTGYKKLSKPYYKRCYRKKSSSYLKRLSNKKIRRYRGELKSGYQCHKLYDFWWNLC